MNMDSGQHGRNAAGDVDQWLEDGIGAYSQAEPRAGLEGRVLAGIAAQGRQTRWRFAWWGVLAFGCAVLVIAVVWLGLGDRKCPLPGPIAKVTVPERVVPEQSDEAAIRDDESSVGTTSAQDRSRPGQATPVRQKLTRTTPRRTPRLEQFPSPRPLSEQEQILMSYVAKYPETAVLVAQARTEEREQERKEEEAEAAQGSSE
jgi:hypothetical protein